MNTDRILPSRDLLQGAPLGRLVAVAGHRLSQRWSRYLADHGLSPAGMTVIFTLGQLGESTHRKMAEHCFIRPATLTGVVDTLERDGFVERRRDETDRRAVRLALTDRGRETIQSITERMRSQVALTSVDADPEKAAVIRDFLVELIAKLSDEEDPGSVPDDPRHHIEKPGDHPC